MTTVILIAGSPGSGKTTISHILRDKLGGVPMIDFGSLREFHLETDWSNQSAGEEQMAFDNLLYILSNYSKNGYEYVIVNDLKDNRVQDFPNVFSGSFKIFTLVLSNDVLSQRMKDPTRDSGFTDIEAASRWNKQVKERATVKNEFKIDNTHKGPEKTVDSILELIKR